MKTDGHRSKPASKLTAPRAQDMVRVPLHDQNAREVPPVLHLVKSSNEDGVEARGERREEECLMLH